MAEKEYIDKEELLGSLERKIKADNERGMAVVDSDFIALVDDATLIEDVVEVVRCKDCKKRGRSGCIVNLKMSFGEHHSLTKLNDFCSYGERKEEKK